MHISLNISIELSARGLLSIKPLKALMCENGSIKHVLRMYDVANGRPLSVASGKL